MRIGKELGTAAIAIVVLTIFLGLAYPLAMTGISQVAFPNKADGSQIKVDGKVVGSRLIARVDGESVLEAEVGELGFSGPAGFRTDNVDVELELLAVASDSAIPCTRGGD